MTPAGLLATSASAALEAAVADLAAGRMALLVEPAETGGAGFLVAAGRLVSADVVATMLREAVGMPLLALTEERCRALELWPLGRPEPGGPPPAMVAIEATEGVTTGISAADRALTMRVACDPESRAGDVVKPGHITAHRIDRDALLRRPGAFAAAAELAVLAGQPGGAAVCQALDAAGQPATGAELEALAERLGVRLVSTLDVLDRRLHREALVQRVEERTLETAVGTLRTVAYADRLFGGRHVALLSGSLDGDAPVRLDVHVQDPLADAFERRRRERLDDALRGLADGPGVLLMLAPRGEDLPGAVPADVFAAAAAALLGSLHHAHVTTQLLADLGVRAVRTTAAGA